MSEMDTNALFDDLTRLDVLILRAAAATLEQYPHEPVAIGIALNRVLGRIESRVPLLTRQIEEWAATRWTHQPTEADLLREQQLWETRLDTTTFAGVLSQFERLDMSERIGQLADEWLGPDGW